MHYYAFDHSYGINMRDERGDLIGELQVFASRKARDAWVDGEDYLDGNVHRDKLDSHKAHRILIETVALLECEFPEIVSLEYTTDALIARIAKESERGLVYGVIIHEEA